MFIKEKLHKLKKSVLTTDKAVFWNDTKDCHFILIENQSGL